jgi:hypothetical protein
VYERCRLNSFEVLSCANHAGLPLAEFQAHDVLGVSELLVQAWKALLKVK